MASSNKVQELTPDKLRWCCDSDLLKYDSSKAVKPDDVIIGQERAVNAIHLGLEISRQGYNIFISGLAGTGRTTTVKHLLETSVTTDELPPDIVYLHNFKDEDQPVSVHLRFIFLPVPVPDSSWLWNDLSMIWCKTSLTSSNRRSIRNTGRT
jgi:ATP-dependent Lon protease